MSNIPAEPADRRCMIEPMGEVILLGRADSTLATQTACPPSRTEILTDGGAFASCLFHALKRRKTSDSQYLLGETLCKMRIARSPT